MITLKGSRLTTQNNPSNWLEWLFIQFLAYFITFLNNQIKIYEEVNREGKESWLDPCAARIISLTRC